MNTVAQPAAGASWRTPLVVLICGTLILLISLGVRQTFGLLLAPISEALGWGREVFSFAVALQALMWGIATPLVGVVADRYGPGRVVAAGAIVYAAGLVLMSQATTKLDATIGIGFFAGVGMAATMFPIIMSAIARVTPEKRRSLYLGIAAAGGSSGMIVMVPGGQLVIQSWGWAVSLVVFAAIVALIAPLAAAVAVGPPRPGEGPAAQSVGAAVREARGHRGYLLLTAGYFVCGFQTMFIGAHLPAMLGDFGISPGMGAMALTLIGLFNVVSCFLWGAAGGRLRSKNLLCVIYLGRSVLMTAFFLFPVSEAGVVVFACALGLFWLGTVPLTGAVIVEIFGAQYVATLYGITYLSHQLGSFLGIWLGGVLFDATGTYAIVWWASVALGLVAALLHYPIDDRPIARTAAQRA